MTIFIVYSKMFPHDVLGVYSTLRNARTAIENALNNCEGVTSFEDIGDYCYVAHTLEGTDTIEIFTDTIDYMYEEDC